MSHAPTKNLMVVTATPAVLEHWLAILHCEEVAVYIDQVDCSGQFGTLGSRALAQKLIAAVAHKAKGPAVGGWSLSQELGTKAILIESSWVIPADRTGQVYGGNTTGSPYGGH